MKFLALATLFVGVALAGSSDACGSSAETKCGPGKHSEPNLNDPNGPAVCIPDGAVQ